MMRAILLSCAVLLALNLITVSGQCGINRQMVERTTRIFMNRNQQGQLSLKRTATAASGEVMHMFCSMTDIRPTTCQRNRNFQPALPMTCQAQPVATTVGVQDRNCPPPGSMFRVGYRAGQQFLELYRACFDTRAVRAIFVDHRIYGKPFIATRPCVRFTSDGVIRQADEASYTTRNVLAAFRATFGINQNFIPTNLNTVTISRGHLAASADFLFGDQMCATFKFVNIVPQFLTINNGNWENIERWTRGQVTGNNFLDVRTGATGILELQVGNAAPRPVYLNGRRNPVPLWMYKRVINPATRQTTIFLTLNNIYARRRPTRPRFCLNANCPPNINLQNTAQAGYTFCCDPSNFRP